MSSDASRCGKRLQHSKRNKYCKTDQGKFQQMMKIISEFVPVCTDRQNRDMSYLNWSKANLNVVKLMSGKLIPDIFLSVSNH